MTAHASSTSTELRLIALASIPQVRAGDDIASLTIASLQQSRLSLQHGDVLVIAQKIVSKAEGRMVNLANITPSPRALELASHVNKNPRIVELILRESVEVVRYRKDVLIVAHRCGYVLANAGIDASNVCGDGGSVLLLPEDSNRSCLELRARLAKQTGVAPGVIINDSLGRAWRNGTVGAALGSAGIPALLNLRGRLDLFGRELVSTEVGVADEIAAAASLLMGQANEGRPVILVRGLNLPESGGSAADLIRPRDLDLFR
ncbi:MAG: coenzyme F420-0:L-glutamate ligase [Pseudolabrys sp.]|nr:coenzyme F420-0:L-glutamate ligase [Pseudolabrys sp.]MDP2296997.1 coenzyme F420-0:L-glutamate ligase [Pseudolabrys sp.]